MAPTWPTPRPTADGALFCQRITLTTAPALSPSFALVAATSASKPVRIFSASAFRFSTSAVVVNAFFQSSFSLAVTTVGAMDSSLETSPFTAVVSSSRIRSGWSAASFSMSASATVATTCALPALSAR